MNDEFEKEKTSLDETITKIREELRQVKQEREEGEQQLEQLSQELDTVDMELEDVKKVNAEKELQMKQTNEKKVAQIENRTNKLKMENSKYDLENVRNISLNKTLKDFFFFRMPWPVRWRRCRGRRLN